MRKNKTSFIGIIITIIVLIILVFLSNVKSGSLSYIENVFSSIIMPIQNGYTYLKNKVSGNSSFFTSIDSLQAENDLLKSEKSNLEQSLRELEIIKAENETLKEFLGLTQKYVDYKSIPAYIISKDISNYSNTFIINAGTKDGVSQNMTVLADQGLVGYVISVTDSTAKVQTIIDSSSSVTANIGGAEESIICKGSLEDGMLKGTYIPVSADISEEDEIVTSGMGGIYPKGIVIGKIKTIEETKNILDRYVWIEPAVDFNKLETVIVVTKN